MKAIVLILRGLHSGYLGCYGNGWIATPGFDQLAAEGVVFDQHVAESPEAVAARRAWRTGRYQLVPAKASGSADDLLSVIGGNQIATSLVVDAGCGELPEFQAGWDQIETVTVPGEAEASLDRFLDTAHAALERITRRKQWLMWLDWASLLPPWRTPLEQLEPYLKTIYAEDEDESDEEGAIEPLPDPSPGPLAPPADESFLRLQATFAGAVSYADTAVAWLLERMRDLGDDALLLVTTDHGQALGEHGIVGPFRPWLHEELVHVPLLLRLPGRAEAGRRVSGLTQAVDLYPTLLDAFGLPLPDSHGYSLLPLARGKVEQVRSHICCGLRGGGREEWALRTPEWSYLLPIAAPDDDPPRNPQLFVKPDDRWEVNNVIQHHWDLAERLDRALRAFMAAPRRLGLETPWTEDSGGATP